MLTALALIPDFVHRNLGWWLFGAILVAGIALGLRDLSRFSLKRVWAIGSVSMIEARRRRVFWIVPVAFLGVVIVSQFQRPLDEQDAIRQTTKFCIFATGLVVAVTTIILACTNLPREIENRVIYSVVTKPTTRLEVVLGKLVGFARVSFWILLFMGILSWGYLSLRAWSLQRYIAQRLETPGAVSGTSVATLSHYRDAGLLSAKSLQEPTVINVYARQPDDSTGKRYFLGGGDGSMLVAYDIDPEEIAPEGGEPGQNGLLIRAFLGYERLKTDTGSPSEPAAATEPATTPASTSPTSKPYYGPFVMSPEERAAIMAGTRTAVDPTVSIEVMDAFQNHVGLAVPLIAGQRELQLTDPDGLNMVQAFIEPSLARKLKGRIYIRVTGPASDTAYYADLAKTPVPITLVAARTPEDMFEVAPAKREDGKPMGPIFQGRPGNFGQQIKGGDQSSVGVFQFHDAEFEVEDGMVPFELRSGIERSGSDDEGPITTDMPTQVSVRIYNATSKQTSDEIILQPESNRTSFFRVPAAELEGGNFSVLLRTLTQGDRLGVKPSSLVVVRDSQPFAWNLAKSLLILWLMTVLITAVAIFCSTFLSWPIAVVLTLLILLGHWGVAQLGDSIAPGIGAQVVTDLGLKEPAKAEAVRATVERLSSFLNFISTILPDIGKYAAVEDIERGVAIPVERLRAALMVTLGFGLPLVLLAYLFLKNKEVAP